MVNVHHLRLVIFASESGGGARRGPARATERKFDLLAVVAWSSRYLARQLGGPRLAEAPAPLLLSGRVRRLAHRPLVRAGRADREGDSPPTAISRLACRLRRRHRLKVARPGVASL